MDLFKNINFTLPAITNAAKAAGGIAFGDKNMINEGSAGLKNMIPPPTQNSNTQQMQQNQALDPVTGLPMQQPVNVGMPGSTPVPTGVAQNLMSPVQAGGKILSPINMNPGFEALPENVQNKILKK